MVTSAVWQEPVAQPDTFIEMPDGILPKWIAGYLPHHEVVPSYPMTPPL